MLLLCMRSFPEPIAVSRDGSIENDLALAIELATDVSRNPRQVNAIVLQQEVCCLLGKTKGVFLSISTSCAIDFTKRGSPLQVFDGECDF